MKTFRFLEFPVYIDSKSFNKKIFLMTKLWNRNYYFLIDQIRRSSLSVCLNLAEGSAKASDADFRRYIQNALGSLSETISCLDIALNLNIINENEFTILKQEGENIARQLGGFSRKLQTRHHN